MTPPRAIPVDRGGPAQPLLTVSGLVKHFPVKKTRGPKAVVKAVDGIDFAILKGETLGIVGESGCGKSTTARLLLNLIARDRGDLVFDGEAVGGRALPLREFRRQAQMVFQDSYSSLNPRMTIEDSIAFGPRVSGVPARRAVEHARSLLARVGLEPARFAARYPHELSGGQRQRVNIARSLALEPRLVILDEAVSALDKSVEAQVLNLLLDLKSELNLTYLFISHDLNVVRFICDRVMVMYLGRVVEIGPAETVLAAPAHPYTEALLASMPSLDPDNRTSVPPLAGDPPNPIDPPTGCRFHPRCALAEEICARRDPPLEGVAARQGAVALRDAALQEAALHGVACLARQPGSGHSLADAQVSAA